MRLRNVSGVWAAWGIFLSIGVLNHPASATVEISKQTKKACTVCHVKTGSKELNDTGKYYKAKKTLEGYETKKDKK